MDSQSQPNHQHDKSEREPVLTFLDRSPPASFQERTVRLDSKQWHQHDTAGTSPSIVRQEPSQAQAFLPTTVTQSESLASTLILQATSSSPPVPTIRQYDCDGPIKAVGPGQTRMDLLTNFLREAPYAANQHSWQVPAHSLSHLEHIQQLHRQDNQSYWPPENSGPVTEPVIAQQASQATGYSMLSAPSIMQLDSVLGDRVLASLPKQSPIDLRVLPPHQEAHNMTLPSLQPVMELSMYRNMPWNNVTAAEQTNQQRVAALAYYLSLTSPVMVEPSLNRAQPNEHGAQEVSAYPLAHTLPPVSQTLPKRIKFPVKLHQLLTEASNDKQDDIVSWSKKGAAFKIHSANRFVTELLPKFFSQKGMSSFRRQLSGYGFDRVTRGPNEGSYQHPLFHRDRPDLASHIERIADSKSKNRRAVKAKEWQPDEHDFDLGADEPK